MKHTLPILCFILIQTVSLFSQTNKNLDLIVRVDDYPEEGYSDVWGYVDENGTEYAIIGTHSATVIYSLEDPANPIERAYIPGADSPWRDFKTFENYIYAVADRGRDGLLIINMENAPNEITHSFWQPDLTIRNITGRLAMCHNIYIDEGGKCYLSGCNLNDGGVLIFDLLNDPEVPVFLSAADNRYSHDNYTRNDTIWSADILSGIFSVIDASDPKNPVTIARQPTSNNFTHNCWLSDDGKYLFTTDERANSTVDAYDVSDLNNIKRLDRFAPLSTIGKGTLPHNTHYFNGFLVTSWYSQGLIITDVNRPDNMIEVGSFDTFQGRDDDPNGCWGAYPYLPSGLVLATDIVRGLYIFEPNYVRACYLEGIVTDSITGQSLSGVEIDIITSEPNQALSDASGSYNTGILEAGTYEVRFFKPGYLPYATRTILKNGVLTNLNVKLIPAEQYDITGKVTDLRFGNPIKGAQVQLINKYFTHLAITDAEGNYSFSDIYEGNYEVRVGSWGFQHEKVSNVELQANEVLNFRLYHGYQDDFVLDFNWQTFQENATGGLWVRDEPIGTLFFGVPANPDADIPNDIGNTCYVTGNLGLAGSFDDLDDGTVTLVSPKMDLSGMIRPTLSFHYWLYVGITSPPPNDTLDVFLANETDTLLIDQLYESGDQWRERTIELTELFNFKDQVNVIFEISDTPEAKHIVEAAIDGFSIIDPETVGTQNSISNKNTTFSIYPNPTVSTFTLNTRNVDDQVLIQAYNNLGQLYRQFETTPDQTFGADWPAGSYWLSISQGDAKPEYYRVIKVEEK